MKPNDDRLDRARARLAVLARLRAHAAARRAVDVEFARELVEAERLGAHREEGAATLGEFAERNGVGADAARMLLHLGHALADVPALEAEVRAGVIPAESAAVLGEVLRSPLPLVRPGDTWVAWARAMDTRDLRRLLWQRRDEVRAGEPVVPFKAYVTSGVRADLERARALASRKAHVGLTYGQTLAVLVEPWLAKNDPLRQADGKRRVPDTATRPHARYVPASVARAVRRRTGDRCLVHFCRCYWVELGHRVPHRFGSGREEKDLDPACDGHNALYEQGLIRITGPPEAPVVTDRWGNSLALRRSWPEGQAPPAQTSELPLPHHDSRVDRRGDATAA